MKRAIAVLGGFAMLLAVARPSGGGSERGPSVAQSRACCPSAWCVDRGEACLLACESRPGTSGPAVSLEQCRQACGEHVRVCEECCRQPATQCWNATFCW